MPIAFTRAIPATFAEATMDVPADPPIDVAHAREQHAVYSGVLRSLGFEVIELAADDRFPDCCFIEDCAVVADGIALITRSGAESRRGETSAVSSALEAQAGLSRIERLDAPATLDGGDCMRVGRRIFVGLSSRTNLAGAHRVRDVFSAFTVVPVPVAGWLHLRCVCSPLNDDRVLLAEGTIAPKTFDGLDVVMIPNSEAYAANCVAHRGAAIIADGFPETRARIMRAGIRTIAIATSEIRKADGSLTCLSIVI